MASSEYLYQLIGQMFGSESEAWLDTPNPDLSYANGWQKSPRPRDLVNCRACREHVLRYLEGLSSTAAVKRTQAFRHNTQVGE